MGFRTYSDLGVHMLNKQDWVWGLYYIPIYFQPDYVGPVAFEVPHIILNVILYVHHQLSIMFASFAMDLYPWFMNGPETF